MLFASLVYLVHGSTGLGQPVLFGMYGTILLHEDMGLYILVGTVSFTVAVIITLLCIRYRENAKYDRRSSEEDLQGEKREKDH